MPAIFVAVLKNPEVQPLMVLSGPRLGSVRGTPVLPMPEVWPLIALAPVS